ncbi:MAG: flagellar hook-basal body complex protein [Dehalococcoidia bacterium]
MRSAGSGLAPASGARCDRSQRPRKCQHLHGFKRARANFEDVVIAEDAFRSGATAARGVVVREAQRIETAGGIESTGNPFDLAITGAGFFVITLPDGTTGYSHDGTFALDGAGALVNGSGGRLTGVELPAGATALAVDRDGTVNALVAGAWQRSGEVGVAVFPNPAGLQSAGEGIFLPTAASGEPAVVAPGSGGAGEIVAGVREMSNVQIGDELVSMLVARRAYSASVRSVQSIDEMIQQANTLSA